MYRAHQGRPEFQAARRVRRRGPSAGLLLTEGQMSDFNGAALMFDAIPDAKALLGVKGYDANWFRDALKVRGIEPCIPPKSNRITAILFDKTLYKSRHKIENMFGKLKNWRPIHTSYDRCAHAFMSRIAIAATIIFGSINKSRA
jgi:transposase